MPKQVGYKVIGTVTRVKGHCECGHKVGDKFELSGYSADGLCGFFYHDLYPYILMLQLGGKFPKEWGPPGWDGKVSVYDCMDIPNALRMELRVEK